VRQQLGEHVVAHDVQHDVARLERLEHDLLPAAVDAVEALRLLRQLLGDVARGEDGLEVDPHRLHLDPHLKHVTDRRELAHPALHRIAEGRDVA
jgi:hypothetical protein